MQPCELRQQLLAACHHHPPQPSSVLQALHVQVGDVSDAVACGLRLPLDVTVAQLAQWTPQLVPPQSSVEPTPQLAARAGAPRHAHRFEPAQSRCVRLTKRGLEHIFGRHQGHTMLRPQRDLSLLLRRWRWWERRLGERCRLLRLAHVVLGTENHAQLLDALASEEASVQLTGGSTEGVLGVEAVGACHHSDELLGRVGGQS